MIWSGWEPQPWLPRLTFLSFPNFVISVLLWVPRRWFPFLFPSLCLNLFNSIFIMVFMDFPSSSVNSRGHGSSIPRFSVDRQPLRCFYSSGPLFLQIFLPKLWEFSDLLIFINFLGAVVAGWARALWDSEIRSSFSSLMVIERFPHVFSIFQRFSVKLSWINLL